MQAVMQSIVTHSKMEMVELNFSDPAQNSFNVSLKLRMTGFGPINALITPMRVKLQGPAGIFTSLDLPEIHIGPNRGDVIVENQRIEILDAVAFEEFVKAAVLKSSVKLTILDGNCLVTAIGLVVPLTFQKEMSVRGMEHLQVNIESLFRVPGHVATNGDDGVPVTAVVRLKNPSPFQMDVGRILWRVTLDPKNGLTGSDRGGIVNLISSALERHLSQYPSKPTGETEEKLFAEFVGAEPLTILRGETQFEITGLVRPSLGGNAIQEIAKAQGVKIEDNLEIQFSTPAQYLCCLRGVKVESIGKETDPVPEWMDRVAQTISLPVSIPINLDMANLLLTS